jgi:hypothetical protein
MNKILIASLVLLLIASCSKHLGNSSTNNNNTSDSSNTGCLSDTIGHSVTQTLWAKAHRLIWVAKAI